MLSSDANDCGQRRRKTRNQGHGWVWTPARWMSRRPNYSRKFTPSDRTICSLLCPEGLWWWWYETTLTDNVFTVRWRGGTKSQYVRSHRVKVKSLSDLQCNERHTYCVVWSLLHTFIHCPEWYLTCFRFVSLSAIKFKSTFNVSFRIRKSIHFMLHQATVLYDLPVWWRDFDDVFSLLEKNLITLQHFAFGKVCFTRWELSNEHKQNLVRPFWNFTLLEGGH